MTFREILVQLIKERGIDIFEDTERRKTFIYDYTGTDYKKEKRRFIEALDEGYYKKLSESGDRETMKKVLIRNFHEDCSIDPALAEETILLLADLIEERYEGQPVPQSQLIRLEGPLQNFVCISAGTFTMGSPSSEIGWRVDEAQHRVTISRSFYMSKYEVTQREYQEVMGTNPCCLKGDSLPVERVSWYDAVEYCIKRSEKEGLTPAYTISGTSVTWNRNATGYRLPTEAEWEYACRAGTTTPFYTGSNITTNQANYDGDYPYNNNAKGRYREKPWVVGSGTANPVGLYDMSGNVWEWCWDWKGSYASGAQTDPTGLISGSDRVKRGGSWSSNATRTRSAYRSDYTPTYRNDIIGFRVVRP